jgi:cytochrome c peroxidase
MITGIRPDAETAVRAGIRHIQFAVATENQARSIDAYLKSLKPVPSPYLNAGAALERGRRWFQESGCAWCHLGPHYTDLRKYDLGTGQALDAGRPLDTPTLVEVWRTAPYLNDGRAATIQDVLTTFNPEDRHGQTSDLSPEDIEDLAAYVLSL